MQRKRSRRRGQEVLVYAPELGVYALFVADVTDEGDWWVYDWSCDEGDQVDVPINALVPLPDPPREG